MVFDLRQPHDAAPLPLVEVQGRLASVRTMLSLTHQGGALRVVLQAQDPDPMNLLASAQLDRQWPALYEEDCLQVLLSLPGEATPSQIMLVNARGQATGAAAWVQRVTHDQHGWEMLLLLPLPHPTPAAVGFSLHRYYRGIRGEVQGLSATLPWPMASADMAVVLLAGDGEPSLMAEAFRQQARSVAAAQTASQLAAVQARLTAGQAARELVSEAHLKSLARAHDELPVPTRVRAMCWNEGHYLMGLLTLFELDRQPEWLERAARRITQLWDQRGSIRGQPDSLWGEVLPTWYDTPSGDGVCTLSSGVILRPIGRFIRLVMSQPEGEPWRAQARHWLTWARTVYAVHQREFIPLADGSGTWLEPYTHGPRRCYPRGGSRPNPFNRIHFLLLPMLDLLHLEDDPTLRQQLTMQARYFLQHCRVTSDDCLLWEYEPGPYPSAGEDLSHAACQAEFIVRCYQEGIVFGELEVRRAANTLTRRILRHHPVPVGDISGDSAPTLDLAIAAWCHLAPWAPTVLPAAEQVLATALHEAKFDFIKEGWGIRLLSQVALARQHAAAL